MLGKTGLKVGRLGIASGYKAPAAAIEEAFERGCNYFTWGTVIKGYVPGMREALKSIVAKGQRDKLVLAAFAYAHSNFLTERLLARGLRSAGLDHADVLILGYFSRKPPRRLIEGAMAMKKKGLIRFVGLSSHNRKMLGELAGEGELDVLHLRGGAGRAAGCAVDRGTADGAEGAALRARDDAQCDRRAAGADDGGAASIPVDAADAALTQDSRCTMAGAMTAADSHLRPPRVRQLARLPRTRQAEGRRRGASISSTATKPHGARRRHTPIPFLEVQ